MRRHAFYIRSILFIILALSFETHAQKLTLEQAVEEAIAHNPDLLKVGQKVRAAKANFWRGISPENPEFFMEFGGVPENQSWSNFRERKTGFVQKLEFPLSYLFKGHWHNLEKRRVYAEFELLRSRLVNDVKKKFFKLLLLRRQNQLYDEITRISRQNYAKARIRVLAGESTSYDTLKVKVDLAEVENRVLALQKEREIVRSELAMLLGRNEKDTIDIEGSLSYTPIHLDQDRLQKMSLTKHPLVREAETLIRQKGTQRNLSWTNLMPDFHLKYFRHELPEASLNNAWGGEIGFSIPLWAFLKEQGTIRMANYELQAARFQFESTKRSVLLKVDEAFSKLLIAEKQVQNYRENTLKEVEELVRIASRSYEVGEMGYLELAEAMRSLNRIKAGYFEALYRYLAAQADLEKAVGVSINIEE